MLRFRRKGSFRSSKAMAINMEEKMIEKTTRGRVRILTWRRLPANAFDRPFLEALRRVLLETERESCISCIVLESGIPGVFSSGLDLRSLVAGLSCRREVFRAVSSVHRLIKVILKSRKIYIAALSGAVIGSAVSIAMACDFRTMSPDAWLWLPDPQYGGLMGDGTLTLISRSCGASAAKRICLTNERISAEEACRMGITGRASGTAKAAEQALLLADRLSELSAETLKNTKKILNRDIPVKFSAWNLLRTVREPDMMRRLENLRLL